MGYPGHCRRIWFLNLWEVTIWQPCQFRCFEMRHLHWVIIASSNFMASFEDAHVPFILSKDINNYKTQQNQIICNLPFFWDLNAAEAIKAFSVVIRSWGQNCFNDFKVFFLIFFSFVLLGPGLLGEDAFQARTFGRFPHGAPTDLLDV